MVVGFLFIVVFLLRIRRLPLNELVPTSMYSLSLVVGHCLEGIWELFGGYLGIVWRVFGNCLGGIWELFGGYLGINSGELKCSLKSR